MKRIVMLLTGALAGSVLTAAGAFAVTHETDRVPYMPDYVPHLINAIVYCEQESYAQTGRPYVVVLIGWQGDYDGVGHPRCMSWWELPENDLPTIENCLTASSE